MKRTFITLISFTLIFVLSGCSFIGELVSSITPTAPLTDEEISLQQQEFINIGFSNSVNEDDIEKVLSLDELNAWENPYAKYSSYILYDTLTDDEKLVYHALEYALVNSYENTFIDHRIDVTERRAEEIAELLSLDTPLLEQNLVCIAYSQVAFYDYEYSEERTVKVLHRNTTINVRNFTRELWNQKMLALDIAETVIDDLDQNASEIELAEEIYRYIAESVTYIPYENEYGHYQGTLKPFLYDTFVLKKTHCDGFTNALALLYAMAGFEQVEKHNVTTMGHTWNCVKIEGKWYNIEGTAGEWIPQSSQTMGAGLSFAFPDYLHEDYADSQELYPDCESSYYMNPDGYTESCDSDDFFDIILEGFRNHNDEWALIIVDEYDEDAALRELDNLAYTYYTSMKFVPRDTADGKTALLYVKGSIL